jgi:hypothetical protein
MKTWLFKPFDRLAGAPALGLGLLIIAITALLAWRAGLHTDGVLDLHFGPSVALWVVLVQGLINWLCLSAMLLVAGMWLSTGRFRLIDLVGVQALARWPIILAVGWSAVPAVGSSIEARTVSLMAAMPDQPGEVIAPVEYLFDAMWLMLLSMPILVAIIWMVWLMYYGYRLVTNLSGHRAVLSFIAALVIAEILSKLLIHFLLQAVL